MKCSSPCKVITSLTLFLALIAAIPAFSQTNSNSVSNRVVNVPDPARFKSEIQAFLTSDVTNAPEKDKVLFVGSSTIRLWKTVGKDMAPLPVYNRGFGGATTYDILYYLDKIVIPYAPRVIVFYCGTNDFGPESHDENGVFERTRKFFEIVRQKLPETKIVYISIVRCPFRKAYWSNMNAANEMIRNYCATHDDMAFVDVNPGVFDEKGEPKLEFYQKDKLHFNEAGYRQISSVIRPVVTAAFRK